MSSKSQLRPSKEIEATSTSDAISEVQGENLSRDEEIRRRAYEIHLERGELEGFELDNWLQAERELERRLSQGKQTG